MRMRAALCSFAFAAAGCTFTGLADYDVPLCDPTLPLAEDPCNALNNGATGCLVFQCNASTRRCVRGTRDADRDGDPSPACGGHDCDDQDARRSSTQKEVCDGIDNDCDNLTDNGMLSAKSSNAATTNLSDISTTPDFTFSDDNGADTYVAYAGTDVACVHALTIGGNDVADGGCISVGPTGGPPHARQSRAQPVGLTTSSVLGIAFVDQGSTTCAPAGQLAFSNGLVSSAPGDCNASLPTLAAFQQQTEAVIAFYDSPISTQSPSASCASLAGASLRVRYVDRPASTNPDLTNSSGSLIGTAKSALSIRPPALVPIPGAATLLLASPLGSNAGLYGLTDSGTIVPLAPSISQLANARSVSMAVGSDGSTTRVAIVAEQQCAPTQSITLVIGDLDPGGPSLSGPAGNQFQSVSIVAAGAAVATEPYVAWVASRKEWWVTWLDDQQMVQLVRVAEDGSKSDAKLAVAKGALATIRSDSPIDVADAGARSGASVVIIGAQQTSLNEVNVYCANQP